MNYNKKVNTFFFECDERKMYISSGYEVKCILSPLVLNETSLRFIKITKQRWKNETRISIENRLLKTNGKIFGNKTFICLYLGIS